MSSSEVKAEVKTWVGTFVKLLLGFSGAAALIIYSKVVEQTERDREELKSAIHEIRTDVKLMDSKVNHIETRLGIIEYQLKKQKGNEINTCIIICSLCSRGAS